MPLRRHTAHGVVANFEIGGRVWWARGVPIANHTHGLSCGPTNAHAALALRMSSRCPGRTALRSRTTLRLRPLATISAHRTLSRLTLTAPCHAVNGSYQPADGSPNNFCRASDDWTVSPFSLLRHHNLQPPRLQLKCHIVAMWLHPSSLGSRTSRADRRGHDDSRSAAYVVPDGNEWASNNLVGNAP